MSYPEKDAAGNPVLTRDAQITKVGGTPLTGRDLSLDLQVLTDLKKGAQNTDGVTAETTAAVLKVLALIQGVNISGTLDRIGAAPLETGLTTETGLVVNGLTYGRYAAGNLRPVQAELGGDSLADAVYSLVTTGHGYLFNSATWDRRRGNTELTLLSSATRTASTLTPTQTNHNARGVIITMTVTARTVGASPLAAVNLSVRDPSDTSEWRDILLSGSFDPTVSTHVFVSYPGAAQEAIGGSYHGDIHAMGSIPLGRTWRVYVGHIADITNLTYSLGALLIL